jgi:peptide/nickel transport system permease protein
MSILRTWVLRLLRLAGSLVAVLTLTFLMIQLIPGDPVRQALGPSASAALVTQRRDQLGLNEPIIVQYLDYWRNALTGNFGTSIISSQPVSLIVQSRILNTLVLVVASILATMIISVLVGMAVGIATHRGRRPGGRFAFNITSGLFAAIPDFLVAVVLVFLFGVTIKIFPVAGADTPNSFVLPVVAIILGSAATLARIVRSSTDTVLDQDYILVARSKRLPRARIYFRHALPNTLTAALTLGGLQLGTIITGTIIVENVFAIPGLGSALVSALISRDFPVAQAMMLIFASAVLILNVIVDALLLVFNPRSQTREA